MFRTIKAIGAIVTTLNLEFLIVDILKEQRNPTSIIFKKITFYRANRSSKCQGFEVNLGTENVQ